MTTFSDIKDFMKANSSNCPFCNAEIHGVSKAWGMSDDGWREVELQHKTYHENGLLESKNK